MRIGDLLRLAVNQKLSECLVGARACCLFLRFRGYSFCISELLGKGCMFEEAERIKRGAKSEDAPLSFIPGPLFPRHEISQSKIQGISFSVYWRDESTRKMIFLGEIIERRKKERKNNLQDLLIKARSEFSNRVPTPHSIFLLGP